MSLRLVKKLFFDLQLLPCGFFLFHVMSSKSDPNMPAEREERGRKRCWSLEKGPL